MAFKVVMYFLIFNSGLGFSSVFLYYITKYRKLASGLQYRKSKLQQSRIIDTIANLCGMFVSQYVHVPLLWLAVENQEWYCIRPFICVSGLLKSFSIEQSTTISFEQSVIVLLNEFFLWFMRIVCLQYFQSYLWSG